jgi:hypothetical protein
MREVIVMGYYVLTSPELDQGFERSLVVLYGVDYHRGPYVSIVPMRRVAGSEQRSARRSLGLVQAGEPDPRTLSRGKKF